MAWPDMFDFPGAGSVAELALSWLLQSTLVIGAGLGAAWLARGRSAVLESSVLRATLLGALLLPAAALLAGALGVATLRIDLSATRGAPPVAVPVAAPSATAETVAMDRSDAARMLAPHAAPVAPTERAATLGPPATIALGSIVAAVWGLGTLALLARLALGLRCARLVRRRARPADAATEKLCRELAGVGVRAPPVLLSAEVESACLVGVLRPAILLPIGSRIGSDVLAHELAHFRRHDCAWNVLRGVGTALLFFQPLLWLLSRRLERAAENCCDDLVVSLGLDRVGYARALVEVAERSARSSCMAAALSIVPLRSTLGHRVARILDTTRVVSVRIGTRRTILIAGLSACATMAAGLIGAQGQEKAPDQSRVSVSGRVVDPAGKPYAGAVLHLVAAKDHAPLVGKSDASGSFAFALETRPVGKLALAAAASGLGFAFTEVAPADFGKSVELKLVRDLPVRGRILDADGQPVEGVEVRVDSVRAPAAGNLDATVRDRFDGGGKTTLAKIGWSGPVPGQPERFHTAADGRFSIAGLGAERVAYLLLDGPRIHCARIDVMTRAASGDQDSLTSPFGGVHYFAAFEHVSPLARTVRGVVRERGTGKPITGAVVKGVSSLPPYYVVTDSQGKFEAKGCSKRSHWRVEVTPKQDLHFATIVTLKDTPGAGPLEVNVELDTGIVVRGKVIDAEAGQPVEGEVVYEPLRPNPFVAKLVGRHVWSEASLAADGSYAISVLPGPGVLGVRVGEGEASRRYAAPSVTQDDVDRMTGGKSKPFFPDSLVPETGAGGELRPFVRSDYKALVLINPAEDAAPFERDVRLERGRAIEGCIVGPDGERVTGVSVHGLEAGMRPNPRVIESDRFVVEGLTAREPRQLLFYDAEKKLAALTELRLDQVETPFTVRLAACGSMSATLLDQNGLPVREALVEVRTGLLRLGNQRVRTDAEGKLRADGLIPGARYAVSIVGAIPIVGASVVPEAGKTTELGTKTLRPEQIRFQMQK